MDIFSVILTLGVAGIVGFIIYWFTIAAKAGLDKTKEDINNDPRFK